MKLLVTDIDSTLSVGETVSDEVVSACRTLRDNGWRIMIATGRTLQSCLSHIRQISAINTAIVYDGARVMDAGLGREIMGFELPHDDALEILEFSWDSGLEIQITGDEVIYCRESDTDTRGFCNSTGLKYSIIDSPVVTGKVYRAAFWGDINLIRSFELRLRNKFNERFNIIRGGDNFLDILPACVSKGFVLNELIRKGYIEKPEILAAAGDHLNDYDLLAYADISAVPQDCAPEVLKLADIIMPSVKEHGFSILAKILIDNKYTNLKSNVGDKQRANEFTS